MKNRFIILVDLSTDSEHLIRFAYKWNKNIGAEMLLVHSTPVVLPVLTPYESKKTLIEIENRKALENMKRSAKSILPNIRSVKFFASEEPLVHELKKLLRGPFNDLVFIGLRKKGLLEKFFIGSEAVKVIDGIDNLIAAVPLNPECCLPEKIHVAVQKSTTFNIIAFNKFLNFRRASVKKIVFFSAVETSNDWSDAEKYLQDLTRLYSDQYSAAYELFKTQSVFQDLKNIILNKKDDFIIVQRGSRFFLDLAFRKFLINELVHEGNIPMVVLP